MNDATVKIGGDLNPLKNELAKIPQSVASMAQGVAGTLGVGLGVSAVIGAAVQTANKLHGIEIEARKAGVGVEFYQKLLHGADETGMDSGGVLMAFRKIKEMSQNALTDSKSAENMSKLGLSFEDVKDLNPEQLFKKVTSAMNGMANEADRNNIAQDIFAKRWQDIIPFIQDYEMYAKELQAQGGIFSTEDVARGAALADKMEELGRTKDKLLMNSGIIDLTNLAGTGINEIVSGSAINNAYALANSMTGRTDSASDPISILGDLSAVLDAIYAVANNTSRIPGDSSTTGGRP